MVMRLKWGDWCQYLTRCLLHFKCSINMNIIFTRLVFEPEPQVSWFPVQDTFCYPSNSNNNLTYSEYRLCTRPRTSILCGLSSLFPLFITRGPEALAGVHLPGVTQVLSGQIRIQIQVSLAAGPALLTVNLSSLPKFLIATSSMGTDTDELQRCEYLCLLVHHRN